MSIRAINARGRLVFTFFLAIFFLGCENEAPEKTPESFRLPAGYRLEVMAAAPLVHNPVAMTFDEWGRLWVVEMTGYMRDAYASREENPTGQIRLLTDQNGDGRMDHVEIFLDNLVLPRAVARVRGGILYAEPPNLWFVPEVAGKAGDRQLVDSAYAVGGNVEHQPNGLLLSLDNWIYSAKSDQRYRWDQGAWHKEKTAFRGQWGITQDDYGHLFYNHNSNPLIGDLVLPGLWEQNSFYAPSTGNNEKVALDLGLRAPQPTGVNRGYVSGVLDDDGMLCSFTAACGPLVYRGDQFPAKVQGHAFVCAPEANLIREEVFEGKGPDLTSMPANPEQEFLTSNDLIFRPVNLFNGPDGALYLVDFHRGIIQHQTYLTGYLRDYIESRGFEKIKDHGILYRLVSNSTPLRGKLVLGKYSSSALVALLSHPNAWHRETAQRLLIERMAWSQVGALEKLALDASNPLAQVHALWTLEGLHALSPALLREVLNEKESLVTTNALKLAATAVPISPAIIQPYLQSADREIQLLAWAAWVRQPEISQVDFGEKLPFAAQLKDDLWWVDAVMSAPSPVAGGYYASAFPGTAIDKRYQQYLDKKNKAREAIVAAHPVAKHQMNTWDRQRGQQLFVQHCSGCHGPEGAGTASLAPPLRGSEWVTGRPERLAALVLQGVEGPIQVAGKSYDLPGMAGLRSNAFLSAEELAFLLSYLRQNWEHEAPAISTELVLKVKSQIADREQPFSAAELKSRFP